MTGAIGTPHTGTVGAGLARLLATKPAEWVWLEEVGGQVARQRNRIVQRFLGLEPAAEWLCFIDSDQEVPDSIVPALLATGEELVAATVLERYFPFRVAAFWTGAFPARTAGVEAAEALPPQRVTLHELPAGGTAKVAMVGTGCLLVRRRVLEAMTPPWFRVGEFEADLMSEDLGFSLRATREAGVQPTVLCDARVGHEGRVTYWPGRNGSPMQTFQGRPHSWTVPVPTL